MDDNVLHFSGKTTVDLEPDILLDAAKEILDSVIIIGKLHDGNMYWATSNANIDHMILELEKLKYELMKYVMDGNHEI